MRRAVRFIAVLGLLLAAFTISQTSAVAGVRSAVQQVCPGSSSYPPSPGAIIMASTTTPFVGQTIQVSGKNYCPNEDVALYIGRTHVGTARTDGNGSFGTSGSTVGATTDPPASDPPVAGAAQPVKVPGPVGEVTLLGRGASGLSLDSDSEELMDRAGSSTGEPGSPNGTPGLALTGTELTGLIVLAAVLLGGGGVMLYAGRRKRSVHT